jgi:AcrR family transcriptional regulator
MNKTSVSTLVMPVSLPDLDSKLRHVPTQARSRERLRRVLDAADGLLADQGAGSFTTARVAIAAGIPVGSVYRYFPDKEAIAEALAVRYWTHFAELVAAATESVLDDAEADPTARVLETLADGFRTSPGFRSLWYGGLRTQRIRDATRPARTAIADSVQRILASRWPDAAQAECAIAAQMVVIAGDGLLREAFRSTPNGDPRMLEESAMMLDAYVETRLGAAER